jgi:spore coat protein A, manganese oxidase
MVRSVSYICVKGGIKMNISRRRFLGITATAIAGSLVPWKYGAKQAYAIANSPPLTKWIQPLRGLTALGDPLGIPVMSGVQDPVYANATMYNITVGEFLDQLHPQLGATRLWGYWDTTNPVKRHLGGVIVARRGNASRLRFTNTLPTPHLVPNDITLPGANQAQNRVATHLHGGYVPWISDGGPFDWWTPTGQSGLSFLNGPGSLLDNIPGKPMIPGQADYFYPNDQSTRLMWYHDHAHGITRLNAYAGVATGYLVLDAVNDAYVAAGKIPGLASTIPLVFQDKKFVDPATIGITDPTWAVVARPDVQTLGSLWYEHVYDPKQAKLKTGGAFLPPPNPSCIPEFFGDTMLCNGTVYPLVTVEAKRYRFLLLNACNARFLNINLLQVAPGGEILTDPKTLFANLLVNLPGPKITQIGNEGGFLVTETSYPNNLPFNPVTLTGNLLLGNAERADIIIDFTGRAGQEFIMYNDAPGPFPVGPPTNDYFLGNPANPVQPLAGTGPDTRQILRFKVVPAAIPDPQPAGAILNPTLIDPKLLVNYTTTVAPIPPLLPPAGAVVRNLTLNEDFDLYGRLRQMLGTTLPVIGKNGAAIYGRDYLAPATETPAAGGVEVWNIYNLTADTHPIHFHIVNVQVLSRQPFKISSGSFLPTGVARGPEPDEVGWKETVKMNPGELTSVVMKFDLPPVPFNVPVSPRTGGNEYVWHCHILEHEEHDMMRPLVVSGVNPKLLSVFPYAAGINGYAGGTASFSIFGDNPITSVVSNSPSCVVNWAAGATTFTATVAALSLASVATITVTDSLGKTAITTVEIFGVTPAYAVTITGAAGGSATFGISGGKRPYSVAATAPAPAPTLVLDATGAVIGFTVNVAAATLPAVWTYTVADASAPANTAVVTVNIV